MHQDTGSEGFSDETQCKEPVIEVAIPTWNRAVTVTAAVESALEQDVPVVVHVYDNASDDDTSARLAAIDDARLVIHRWDTNRGSTANLTRALCTGSSEYLLLLFDDEILLPGALRVLREHADADPTLAFVHGDVLVRDAAGRTLSAGSLSHTALPQRMDGHTFIHTILRHGDYVWINSVLFRRSMITGLKFEPGDCPVDDTILLLRSATRGAVGYVPQLISTRTDGNEGEGLRDGYLVPGSDGRDHFTFEAIVTKHVVFERFLLKERDAFTPQERSRLLTCARGQRGYSLGAIAAEQLGYGSPKTALGNKAGWREISSWASGCWAKCQFFRAFFRHLPAWRRLKRYLRSPQ